MSTTADAHAEAIFAQRRTEVKAVMDSYDSLIPRLEHLRSQAADVNIYRPLNAYRKITRLGIERDALRAAVDQIVSRFDVEIKSLPGGTMGSALSSSFDTLRLWYRAATLRDSLRDTENEIQQKGAFAFAVFAFYISIVSLVLGVALGLPPLLR